MEFYLTTFIGTGTRADPFRPLGFNQPGASMIDLRPDCSKVAGRVLVAVPLRDDATIGAAGYLGNDLNGTLGPALLTSLANVLGIAALSIGSTLSSIIADILITEARTDGTRWRPLVADSQVGRLQAWLGGQLAVDQPIISGGAVADNFNRANANTLGANWTVVAGGANDWQIVSNAAANTQGAASTIDARYDGTGADVGSANMYTQLAIVSITQTASDNNNIGPACRMDSSVQTMYLMNIGKDGGNPNGYFVGAKWVSGAFTNLLTETGYTWANTDIAMISASGSTIRFYINGRERVGSPVTDVSITGNQRGGMDSYNENVADVTQGDNFYADILPSFAPIARTDPISIPLLPYVTKAIFQAAAAAPFNQYSTVAKTDPVPPQPKPFTVNGIPPGTPPQRNAFVESLPPVQPILPSSYIIGAPIFTPPQRNGFTALTSPIPPVASAYFTLGPPPGIAPQNTAFVASTSPTPPVPSAYFTLGPPPGTAPQNLAFYIEGIPFVFILPSSYILGAPIFTPPQRNGFFANNNLVQLLPVLPDQYTRGANILTAAPPQPFVPPTQNPPQVYILPPNLEMFFKLPPAPAAVVFVPGSSGGYQTPAVLPSFVSGPSVGSGARFWPIPGEGSFGSTGSGSSEQQTYILDATQD